MIELRSDSLVFDCRDVHPSALLTVSFQRTLRIPDDGKTYQLPPGLGRFPLKHVDDFEATVPKAWLEHGGVMLPMYQAEALWICFDGAYDGERGVRYPFAVKVATGKVNAVSGEPWASGLHQEPQDYVVVPEQPWLDGYCVEKGVIRQFVAMPLGAGYTAEEQVTGKAEYGGLQVMAYPMKREMFERRFPERREISTLYCQEVRLEDSAISGYVAESAMGLAPGGRMEQEIAQDPYTADDWDLERGSRCFVHIANSMVWREVTGQEPPTTPATATEYTKAGLPWFVWYDDAIRPVDGAAVLAGMKSVASLGKQKGDVPLPENQSVTPGNVIALGARRRKGQVREYAD